MRRGMGRVKARLNKIVTESVPMDGHGNGHGPDGHGNGHGPDGQAADGERAPAAIGSPESQDGDER
jgi:hypothetical protein